MRGKPGWNRQFHGVGIRFEPQVIRVANDFVLEVYLESDPKNCMKLAKFIRRAYARIYREELRITAKSLAIEIYGHYKMQRVAKKAETLVGKTPPTRWLLGHTDVIDCGSKEKDNNRFIWDWMSLI